MGTKVLLAVVMTLTVFFSAHTSADAAFNKSHSVFGKNYIGVAGTYGWGDGDHGNRVAYGIPGHHAPFDQYDPGECAVNPVIHPEIQPGMKLLVTNLANGLQKHCRVVDWGPAIWTGRILDTSTRLADILGFLLRGTAPIDFVPVSDDPITLDPPCNGWTCGLQVRIAEVRQACPAEPLSILLEWFSQKYTYCGRPNPFVARRHA